MFGSLDVFGGYGGTIGNGRPVGAKDMGEDEEVFDGVTVTAAALEGLEVGLAEQALGEQRLCPGLEVPSEMVGFDTEAAHFRVPRGGTCIEGLDVEKGECAELEAVQVDAIVGESPGDDVAQAHELWQEAEDRGGGIRDA